jgi:hypothetical protein
MAVMRRLLPLVLLLALACGRRETAASVEPAPDPAQQALAAKEEKEVRAVLARLRDAAAKAQAITLFRVAQPLDENYAAIEKSAPTNVQGYPVLQQLSLTKEQAAPLVQLLASRDSYFPPGEGWTCIFEPHHVLQLASREETITAVICVECGDVQFFTGGENAAASKSVYANVNAQLTTLLNELLRV